VNKPKGLRWSGHVARMGDDKCVQYFGRKTWKEDTLGRHERRWEDNIRMDIREIVWEGMDLIHLAQDRDQWRDRANTVINIQVS